MKQVLALICAAGLVCAVLAGCMNDTKTKAKEMASEAVSDLKEVATEAGFDDDRETFATEENADNIAEDVKENVDEMIDNGQVEDGDGNIGERENSDGDGNTDENAADDAQEQVE